MSNQKWPKKVRVLLACAGIAALGLTVLVVVIARKPGEPRGIVSATEGLDRPRLETEAEMTETTQMTFEDARWQTGGSPEEVGERRVVVIPPKDGRYQPDVVTQYAAFVPPEEAERSPSSSTTTEVTFEDARWQTGGWRDEVKGRQVVVFPLKDGRFQLGVVGTDGAFIPLEDAEPLVSAWYGPPIYGMRIVDGIPDVSMHHILDPVWRRLLDELGKDHPDGSALIRDLDEISDQLERMTQEKRYLPPTKRPRPD